MPTKPLFERFIGIGYDVTESGCWEWRGSRTYKGYGKMNPHATHRVSYQLFVGRIPPGKHVLHRCDNPPCVNPEHLFVGSNRDNVMDSIRKGRWGKRLDPSDVLGIRLEGSQRPWREVAESYGVNIETVRRIVLGESHRELLPGKQMILFQKN